MISLTQDEVMRSWGRTYDHPLLSIACITFNHEKYIQDTLDAFLTQKTNFPFEIIIHDDCSNDETAKIIREYEIKFPKIIKPIFQSENQYSKGTRAILATFVYPKCSGRYIALCEGDDYWIDENKLQKQVDFLEKNPDYGLCYTRAKEFLQNKHSFSRKKFGSYVDSFEDLLIKGNRIPTLTVCAKKELIMQYVDEIKPQEKKWLMGDYPMWLYIALKSKVKFFNKETSVYRVLQNSASHSSSAEKNYDFHKSAYDIRKFFSDMSGISIEDWDEIKMKFYENSNLMKKTLNNAVFRETVQKLYWKLENRNFSEFINYVLSLSNVFVFPFYLIRK